MGAARQIARAQRVLARCRPPPELLRRAVGLCVLSEIRAGVLLSAQVGRGVLLKRLDRYHFGWPSSVMLVGVGAGAQCGGERVDHVLVITDPRVLAALERHQVRLEADMSIAVGPRGADAQSFAAMGAGGAVGVYSYSLARGAFVGLSLAGAIFCHNMFANRAFYGRTAHVADILEAKMPLQGLALTLVEQLHMQLYDLEQDQLPETNRRAVLPLDTREYAQEDSERQEYESRRSGYEASVRERTGSGAMAQRRESRVESDATILSEDLDTDDDEDDEDDDEEETGATQRQAAPWQRVSPGTAANPFDDAAVAAAFANPFGDKQASEASRRGDTAGGALLELFAPHELDERTPEAREHLLLSAPRGEIVTLLEGDLERGLPAPYGEYVLVWLHGRGLVGRMSRHCLRPYYSRPGQA